MMSRSGQWEDNQCPRCGLPEDTTHVLCCPDRDATSTWSTVVNHLESSLIRDHTDPRLTEAIIAGLNSWRTGNPPEVTFPPAIEQAFQHQSAIGWRSLTDGFLSTHWAEAQASYRNSDNFSPTLWGAMAIRRIWQIPWTMWSHRNNALHTGNDNHPKVMQVDRDIAEEIQLGATTLDPSTGQLFRAQATSILSASLPTKLAWLNSIRQGRIRFLQTF
jgi:hypothetical protein